MHIQKFRVILLIMFNHQGSHLVTQNMMYVFIWLLTFQQSVLMCLLKGTDKGIGSLVEESLTITREMLREAQLAYPRNPVRDHNLAVSFVIGKLYYNNCTSSLGYVTRFVRVDNLHSVTVWMIRCYWYSTSVYRSCRASSPRRLTWPVLYKATCIAISRWVSAAKPTTDMSFQLR